MSDKKNHSLRNLYLVGFMGVGKSHFGRLLAKVLKFKFIDSDYEISHQEKCSILKFSKSMESLRFRSECSFIESGHPDSACGFLWWWSSRSNWHDGPFELRVLWLRFLHLRKRF